MNVRHELRLHHARHLVVALRPLAEERVDLINEDDRGLCLASEAK